MLSFLGPNGGTGPFQTMDRVRKTAKAVRYEGFTGEIQKSDFCNTPFR
jgi:hypothetical protein